MNMDSAQLTIQPRRRYIHYQPPQQRRQVKQETERKPSQASRVNNQLVKANSRATTLTIAASVNKKRPPIPSQQHRLLLERLSRLQSASNIGLPVDPFNSWPIKSTPCVSRMAQFFVQVWAPQHGGPFAIEGHSNPYLSLLWPFVLQHDILFEGVIALCLASWLMPQGIRASEDRAFIYHHNNTLAKLQQRLIDPQQCCDDVTLLTMTCLGTIDYVLGNSHGAIAHVEAMRQMIKMRGGQSGDTPWERHIQTQLFAYETMWSFVSEPNSSPVSPTRRPSERILRKRQLPIYPSHPFKPEICEILSKLPQGFSDLGLAGTFSVQMMSILADLSSIKIEEPSDNSIETQDKKNKIASELEDNVEDLLRLATLRTTTTEHYLCYGMVAYCVLLKLLYFPPSSGSFKNDELQNLVDQVVKCNSGVDDMNKNCYIWIVIVIAGCMQNCAHSISGRDQVLKKLFDKSRDAKDWRSMEKILKTFLWDNVIANICRSSWQEALYHYQNPVSPKELPRPSRMSIRDVIL